MNTNYEILFLKALCITVSFESAAILLTVYLIPVIRDKRLKIEKIAAACIIPSVLTLPYLWFILPAFFSQFLIRTISGEIGIFVIESLIIKSILDIKLKYAAFISFFANGLSIAAGLVIFRW